MAMTNIKNNRPTLRKDPQGMQIQEFGNSNTKIVDYAGGANPIYVGYAKPGSSLGDEVWQIIKLTYDVGGNMTNLQWASGSNDFKFEWDERAGYVFS